MITFNVSFALSGKLTMVIKYIFPHVDCLSYELLWQFSVKDFRLQRLILIIKKLKLQKTNSEGKRIKII